MVNSDNLMGTSTAAFDASFKRGVVMAGDTLVQQFEGRDAIVVNVPDVVGNDMTETELNQHPGLLTAEDEADDPTRRAVILGSYSGK